MKTKKNIEYSFFKKDFDEGENLIHTSAKNLENKGPGSKYSFLVCFETAHRGTG